MSETRGTTSGRVGGRRSGLARPWLYALLVLVGVAYALPLVWMASTSLKPADEALSAVVQAVLLSPSLVFKPELVPNGFEVAEHGYAVASRLSLFFRSSIADDALWTLAGTGALEDPRVVETQARRLLESDLPRFTKNFGGQWLDFRDSDDLGPLTALDDVALA